MDIKKNVYTKTTSIRVDPRQWAAFEKLLKKNKHKKVDAINYLINLYLKEK